ncbi:MAG: hypothetical protein OXC48_04470, partial [Endozoicomonadaceae bacterium]|nr:hypothetical protein [Endozoicomonadaceae bacterium]
NDNFVVVSSYSHMTIVKKIEKGKRNKPALWAVNQFSDNGINIVNVRNNELSEVFSNPLTDEIFINGYMRIK